MLCPLHAPPHSPSPLEQHLRRRAPRRLERVRLSPRGKAPLFPASRGRSRCQCLLVAGCCTGQRGCARQRWCFGWQARLDDSMGSRQYLRGPEWITARVTSLTSVNAQKSAIMHIIKDMITYHDHLSVDYRFERLRCDCCH